MTTQAPAAPVNLSSLLDVTLDQVADLPEYATPPEGYYKLQISKVEEKMIKDKPAMVVEYKVVETVQLVDQQQEAPKADTTFSESFFFHAGSDIEKTKSVMKAKFGTVGAAMVGPTATLTQIMKALGTGNVTVLANVQNQRDDKDLNIPMAQRKVYPRVRDISLA